MALIKQMITWKLLTMLTKKVRRSGLLDYKFWSKVPCPGKLGIKWNHTLFLDTCKVQKIKLLIPDIRVSNEIREG